MVAVAEAEARREMAFRPGEGDEPGQINAQAIYADLNHNFKSALSPRPSRATLPL
jgi:hypothetical protein